MIVREETTQLLVSNLNLQKIQREAIDGLYTDETNKPITYFCIYNGEKFKVSGQVYWILIYGIT